MDTSVIYDDIRRFIKEYRWGWGLIHKVINRCYGTNYSIAALQRLYLNGH